MDHTSKTMALPAPPRGVADRVTPVRPASSPIDRSLRGAAQRALSDQIRQSPRVAAQRALSDQIEKSPVAAAQRRRLDAAFGPAIERDPAPDGELAQMKSSTGDGLVQHKPATMGSGSELPTGLKAGVESLSGVSMDGVRVHYNSSKPAQLNALAYAQGTDIHVGPGSEKHLPHEAWHIVQQAQGRVRPTTQLKEAGVPINDDEGLEREADAMGQKALQQQGAGAQRPAALAARDAGAAGAPVQAVMSVADFQARTPDLFMAPRKSVRNIDQALTAYLGPPRTVLGAGQLINIITHYRANSDQAGRVAEAGRLLDRVRLERDVLQVIGNANENILDALIDTVTPANVPQLVQLATAMTAPAAHLLLPLIHLVGIANLADANLLACVTAAGAGNHALLLSMIPLIGGFAQLPALAAVMVGGKTAADAFDLARVAAGSGPTFTRLTNVVPLFHDPAVPAPAGLPGAVVAEQTAYNNAKDAGYAALVGADVTAMVNQANVMRLRGSQFHAPFALMSNVTGNYNELETMRASIAAGPPFVFTPQELAAKVGQLRVRLNGMLNWATAQPVDATGHQAAIVAAHAAYVVAQGNFAPVALPAGGTQRDLETIDYQHFFERHTHEHFDFGDIKALNTMWPEAWGNAPAASLDATLVASINHLHVNGLWLANNVARPNIPTGHAGTQSHMIAYATGNNTLRLGMYYPEPNGAPIFQYTAEEMRALRKLL